METVITTGEYSQLFFTTFVYEYCVARRITPTEVEVKRSGENIFFIRNSEPTPVEKPMGKLYKTSKWNSKAVFYFEGLLELDRIIATGEDKEDIFSREHWLWRDTREQQDPSVEEEE